MIAQGIANAIAALLTTPFVAAAIVALYFDLRIRDEAFDVQLAMQRNDTSTRARDRRTAAQPSIPTTRATRAQHILSGRRFRAAPTPRPFRRPLNWLGDRLHGDRRLDRPTCSRTSSAPVLLVLAARW